jgi:excisionase family DNA binding protein
MTAMTKSPVRPPQLHSIKQIAEQCDVSTKTVRRWIDAGEIHAHRLGRQVRIAHEDLIAFLSARRR